VKLNRRDRRRACGGFYETHEAEGKRLVLKDGAARKYVAVLSSLGLGGRAGEFSCGLVEPDPREFVAMRRRAVLMMFKG